MSVLVDLWAAVAAGTVSSPIVTELQSAISAVGKLTAAANGGSYAPLTDDESNALPLIAWHAGGNSDAVNSFAAAVLAGENPVADAATLWGLAHATSALNALALGAAAAAGIS